MNFILSTQFVEYIIDTADEDMNKAMGVKIALARYCDERLDYLNTYVIPDVKMYLDEDEDYDDTDTAILERQVIASQRTVNNIRIGE